MKENQTIHSMTVKVLAIIGFSTTILLIVWIFITAINRAPATFSSLASIANSIEKYRPIHEFTIATEKSVLNTDESFSLTWTDVKQSGEYHFSYGCVEGISLSVRGENGSSTSITCADALSFPNDVHNMSLSIASGLMRFTDVPLTIVFTNTEGKELFKNTIHITVINATIPVRDISKEVEKPSVPTVSHETKKPVKTTSTTTQPTKPVPLENPHTPTVVYPQSNPSGYVDLKVTMIGSGIIEDGNFFFTQSYDRDLRNAIRFDIKNIGTKTSDTWTFTTVLPGGTVYESKMQTALKPYEHVEFTLGFNLTDKDDLVKITTRVNGEDDSNAKNDYGAWSVVVTD